MKMKTIELERDFVKFSEKFSCFYPIQFVSRFFPSSLEFTKLENIDRIIVKTRCGFSELKTKLKAVTWHEPRSLKDICFASIAPVRLENYFCSCDCRHRKTCEFRHLVFRYVLVLEYDVGERVYDIVKKFMMYYYKNVTWQMFETERSVYLYTSQRVSFCQPFYEGFASLYAIASNEYCSVLDECCDKLWYDDALTDECNENFVRMICCSNKSVLLYDMLCKQMSTYLKCSNKNLNYGYYFDIYKRLFVHFVLDGLLFDVS